MNEPPRTATLNRAVFAQRAFDSSALTVLTTLLHRFDAAGNYEVFVHRGDLLAGRFVVRVGPKKTDHQVNLDMAKLGAAEPGCACRTEDEYGLIVGGLIGFYASEGSDRYTVRITRIGDAKYEKRVLLDSGRVIPAGDFFAVTFVRPGRYRAVNREGKAEAEIRVTLPKRERYRPDQPTLAVVGEKKIEPRRMELLSGHSVVFQCDAAARIRIELTEEDDSIGRPTQGGRFTKTPPKRRPDES